MEGVLAAFAQFDSDWRGDRTQAGMKAALELGRCVFLPRIGYLNAPRAMGKSLMPDPERAPLVRRAFQEYATGRHTREQLLKQTSAWGLINRRGRPPTSQAIGMLLRNRLYTGIVDVPEYGVHANRGDFEPLISEDLFYRVQAVLSGRVPSTTPRQRAHPDFPLLAFVRCSSWAAPHRQLVERGGTPLTEVALCESATRAGPEVTLEAEGGGFIGQYDGCHTLPRSIAGSVCAAPRVVRSKASVHIVREADVRSLRLR
jgi:hypothetical protein